MSGHEGVCQTVSFVFHDTCICNLRKQILYKEKAELEKLKVTGYSFRPHSAQSRIKFHNLQSNDFHALIKGLKFESVSVVCQIVVNLLTRKVCFVSIYSDVSRVGSGI